MNTKRNKDEKTRKKFQKKAPLHPQIKFISKPEGRFNSSTV